MYRPIGSVWRCYDGVFGDVSRSVEFIIIEHGRDGRNIVRCISSHNREEVGTTSGYYINGTSNMWEEVTPNSLEKGFVIL